MTNIFIALLLAVNLLIPAITGRESPFPTYPLGGPNTGSTQSIDFESAASHPSRLLIPKLGIDAYVEHVAEDENGNMDVPKDYYNVAWYSPGSLPGQTGNSVIAGHLDSYTGPAIFYDLGRLNVGDEVYVEDEEGMVRSFVVYDIQVFNNENFPIEYIFGPTDHSNLNLITCVGFFDSEEDLYTERLVIFTRLKSQIV